MMTFYKPRTITRNLYLISSLILVHPISVVSVGVAVSTVWCHRHLAVLHFQRIRWRHDAGTRIWMWYRDRLSSAGAGQCSSDGLLRRKVHVGGMFILHGCVVVPDHVCTRLVGNVGISTTSSMHSFNVSFARVRVWMWWRDFDQSVRSRSVFAVGVGRSEVVFVLCCVHFMFELGVPLRTVDIVTMLNCVRHACWWIIGVLAPSMPTLMFALEIHGGMVVIAYLWRRRRQWRAQLAVCRVVAIRVILAFVSCDHADAGIVQRFRATPIDVLWWDRRRSAYKRCSENAIKILFEYAH